MSYVSPRILDGGLSVIPDEVDRVCFCSAEPATYLEAVEDHLLGYRQAPVFGAIADVGAGRSITMAAFSNGSAISSGDWTHVAFVDTVNGRLLLAHELDATVVVTSGNSVSLPDFAIEMPGL